MHCAISEMVDIIPMEKNTRPAIQNMTTIEKESKLQHDTCVRAQTSDIVLT